MHKRVLRILLKHYTKISYKGGIAKVVFDGEFEGITDEVVKLCTLGAVMPSCATCKHWDKHKEEYNTEGICKQLPNDKINIEISAGFNGGVVDYIETEADFGCKSHERN